MGLVFLRVLMVEAVKGFGGRFEEGVVMNLFADTKEWEIRNGAALRLKDLMNMV